MIYKGHSYSRSSSIVDLPKSFRDEHYPKVKENFVRFGRITVKSGKILQKEVITDYSSNGEPVFATPIALKGWSLTNLAYGKDGRVYLLYDGRCYTRKLQKKTN